MLLLNSILCISFCPLNRNSQRIVHIPFFEVETPADAHLQEALRKATKQASASIGALIAVGDKLLQSRKYLSERIMPFVMDRAEGLPHRVQKCYGLVLLAAKEVSCCIEIYLFLLQPFIQLCTMGLASFREVSEFFEEKWAPIIVRIHQKIADILSDFMASISEALVTRPLHQVYTS